MRKTIICLFLVLTLLAPGLALGEEDLLARAQARGTLIVATEGAWAPWTFHDESDQLVGFDVEVARRIAEKLGVEAQFVETAWDGIFAGLDARRYDLAANGVEITETRAQKYDFSVPYGYIRTALVVRGDNQDVTCFEDLAGKRTANSIASTYMTLAESYGATAVGVDTLDQTISMVLSGRADATLNAEVSIYDYLRVHPDANIKVVALTQEASQVAIPLRKGEDCASLLAAINQAIEELREEGVLEEISMKYFGSDITSVPENNLFTITVNGQSFAATLADTDAAQAFSELLPASLSMTELNGNEKYANLAQPLPADANAPGRVEAGDVMLYGDDCVVLFYQSFDTSYSYTPIGKIADPTGLAEAVGSGDVQVDFGR